MKKTLHFVFVIIFFSQLSYAQWTDLNSGINDNLNGVTFLDNNGIVVGENGIYYTSTYGNGPSSWTRFTIPGNATDSNIYENTVFTDCTSDTTNLTNTGTVYAVGQNTSNNSAVIFKIDLPSLNYEIIYQGSPNTTLNRIKHRSSDDLLFVVGSNGLLLKINSSTVTQINTNMSGDNLKSLDFYGTNAVYVATDGKVGRATIYNNTTNANFSINDSSDRPIADIDAVSFSNYYSVAEDYLQYSSSSHTVRNNFYGDLNANTIINVNANHFVGTTTGILKSGTTRQYLEDQPSSGSNNIKSFWNDAVDNNILYACGDNGVILKTTNLGGETTPYIRLEGEGRCVLNTVNIDYFAGSSTSCDWTVNGNPVSNGCSDFSSDFNDTVGTYEVSVTASNSTGGVSTTSITIHIVNQPQINLSTSLNDAILCKEESIDIEIQNSEPNFRYVLRKDESFNSTIYGVSPEGNGGTITMTSGLISESGDYYLRAESTLADCDRSFTDRFYIEVEQTEASFASSLINATVNEPVVFAETSIDAQNYSWQFDSGANPSTSTEAEVSVGFTEVGPTSVALEVWSDEGCYDDITGTGPNIYSAPSNPESSWTILYGGEDLYNGQFPLYGYPGHHDPEVMNLIELDDGFLTMGYHNDQIFESKYGVSLDFQGRSGGYLAKHNYDGVLKWLVYSPGTQNSRSIIYDAAEDSEGNIYLCGYSSERFYDNHGNVANEQGVANKGYITKLSAYGRELWTVKIHNYFPKRIAVDYNDNVISSGYSNSFGSNILYLNNVATTDEIAVNDHSPATPFSIVKLSSEGGLIWDADMYMASANGAFLDNLGVDANNNVYVSGGYETLVHAYSAGGTTPSVLTGPGQDYGQKMFLSKFNEDGQVQWQVKSLIVGDSPNNTTKPYDMFTDEQGNCYITGRNDARNANLFHTFYNTDGSTTAISAGQYYIAKVNSEGICEWVNGAAHSYYGFGYQVDKQGDRVYAVGRVSNNDNTPEEVYLTSTNGVGHSITINPSDYFIAEYDLDGNLTRLLGNGSNPNMFFSERVTGFFKHETSDAFYMAQSLGYFIGLSGFQNFGHIIAPTNGQDAAISRLAASDGITHFLNQTASVDEEDVLSGLTLYPNPVKDKVFIDFNKVYTKLWVSVFDITGKTISTSNYEDTNHIELKLKGQSGMYFLKIEDNYGRSIIKKVYKL